MKVKSLSCVRLSDPMDCSLPGSSIHGIFQARVLEWVAIVFSNQDSDIDIIYQFYIDFPRITNTYLCVCMCFFSSMQFYHMCRFNKYEGLQTSVVTGISFRCAHFDHRGYLGHEDFFFFLIVFLCHLFLVSSASVRSIQFPSFIKPIFA